MTDWVSGKLRKKSPKKKPKSRGSFRECINLCVSIFDCLGVPAILIKPKEDR